MKALKALPLIVLLAALLPTAPAGAADNVITTVAFQFAPPTVALDPGDSLTYANADPLAPHNVQSTQTGLDGAPLFRSEVIPAGATAAVNGVEALGPGSYPFFCVLHPNMQGSLEIGTVPSPGPLPEPGPLPSPGSLPSLPSTEVIPTPAGAVPTPTSLTIFGTDMYVASWGQNTIVQLPILAGGALGPPTNYVTGLGGPLGIAFAEDGTLFVADSHAAATPGRSTAGRVWAIPPGGGDAGTVGEIVVDELPNGRHNTNGLAVKDGRLYIANGNSTDDGVAGGDPEEPLSGTILSVPLGARDLTPADLQAEPTPEDTGEPGLIIEAFGMRNPFDLAFRPGTEELWTPSNGPDALDPFGEDLLHKAVIPSPPPDFGFPACVYRAGPDGSEVTQNPAVEDTQTCGDHTPPVATLGLHVSANGIAFGPQEGFWDGDAFIAMYGNNPGETNAGHKVVRVPVDEEGNVGPLEDVFISSAPLDVTFGPEGLYVADFGGQIILLRAP